MKNKVLLSLIVFTSILNAENLRIGKYDADKDSETTAESLLNQCLLNKGNTADSYNICTKLVKLNDKLNVYCADTREQSAIIPRSSNIAGGYKHVLDDDKIENTKEIREFNRVNWQYMNAGKLEEMKLIRYQMSLNQYELGVASIFNRSCYKAKINEADDGHKHLILFSGMDCIWNSHTDKITRGSGVNVYQIPPKLNYPIKNFKDEYNVLLPYQFSETGKNNENSTVHAPVLKETFREYTTNTTGRIVLKANVTDEITTWTKDGILIYLTEQFSDLSKSNYDVFVFGDYILGNKSEEGKYGVNMNVTMIHPLDKGLADSKERIYKLLTPEQAYNNYLSSMPKSNTYYGNEDIKKYSEQLILKNTRVSQVPTWGVWNSEFQDKYYGGLTKCYNFDLKKFNTINQTKAIRLGYFLYNNSILNGSNNDINHTKIVNTGEGTFYYSIHKSKDNMAGIYKNDGDYVNYSVNIRPNKSPAKDKEHNTFGNVSANLTFDFYPDAKKIKVVKANGGYNATIELLDINGNIMKKRPKKLSTFYISKYKVKGSQNSINLTYADGVLLKSTASGYQIDCDNYDKKTACAALKDSIKDKDAAFVIQEIKDTNTDDYGDRPVFQTSGENIIKGEETEISKEEPLPLDSFLPYKAWITSGKMVAQNLNNLKSSKNDGNREHQILTRTTDDILYFALENVKNYKDIYVEIAGINNKEYKNLSRVLDIANGKSVSFIKVNYKDGTSKKLYKLEKDLLFELNQHEAGRYDLTLKIYTIDPNTINLIRKDNNKTPLEDIKGASVKEEMSIKQYFSVRHKGLIYQTNKTEQLAKETKDFDFTVNSCKTGSNSLACGKDKDKVAENNKLTYAGLYIKDEKTPGKDAYLYLDDGVGLLNDENAKNPKITVDLKSGKPISIKSSLPLVSKTEIRLFETYLTSNDSDHGQCKPFDEKTMDLKVLNTIDVDTGQIYCQTPMCKNINSKIECDGKGFEYEFKSAGISLNLKDEKEPIKELKGLVPYAGAQKNSSSWDGAIEIDNKEPLKLSLNIQDEDNYYINFAKDKNYTYGLINLNLSFEKGTDKLQQDNKNEYFKNYIMVGGGDDIEIVNSSANKNVDCGYTETITNDDVNIGKCINIKNDSVFTMLEELKKANAIQKLSDLLNDPKYKANDTYGGLTVEVAYPKVDANGNFKTQSPFKVTLQNGYVSNEVSNPNDKYELDKIVAPKSHLFTKTGLYFKDVSNNDGRLFYDKKDLKNPVNNGIKFINENNKIEDLKDCGSEPCYNGKTEDLINKASDYSHDYKDSKIIVDGSDLKYKPHDDNKAEYIKDTIRYSTDKSSYLGSEKNSFTLEYKRN